MKDCAAAGRPPDDVDAVSGAAGRVDIVEGLVMAKGDGPGGPSIEPQDGGQRMARCVVQKACTGLIALHIVRARERAGVVTRPRSPAPSLSHGAAGPR